MSKEISFNNPNAGRNHDGFTLIELMIAVAIVGILAAIAIPTYGEYAVKARVSEMLSEMSSAKISVSETILSNGGTLATAIAITSGNVCVAATFPVFGSRNISSVSCNGTTGVITAVGLPAAGNVVLIFTPTATTLGDPVSWRCTTTSSRRYVPSECV